MDTKEDFQTLQTQVSELSDVAEAIRTALGNVTETTDVTSAEQTLTNVISTLQSFVTTNLNALGGQDVVEDFIAELKTLLDKYTASISITDSSGYGENWGGGEASITFTASLDGATGSKTYNKSSLLGSDL